MNMPYSYAQLTPQDVPLMKRLLAMFGEAFDDVPAYQDAVPSDDYLAALLAKPHFIVLVATSGESPRASGDSRESRGDVVGGLAAYVLDKFERDRREIYIYDLAVAQGHRRRGVATTLIKRLVEIARERRAYVIFVQADRGDEPAIKLYESLGTREDVHHFDIAVPPLITG
jgi:aminoglycoside 3-N-acetyltransferase I